VSGGIGEAANGRIGAGNGRGRILLGKSEAFESPGYGSLTFLYIFWMRLFGKNLEFVSL
jgi:hypothetical protein